MNGAPLRAAEQLRGARSAALVFTPDRLAIVKGSPVVRRAYFDRVARSALPGACHASRRVRGRVSPAERGAQARGRRLVRDAHRPMDAARRELGASLVAARAETLGGSRRRSPRHAAHSGSRRGHSPIRGSLRRRKSSRRASNATSTRGATGLGPHLHDIAIPAGGRDLRRFGSQGEQRTSVLALLLGEAALLTERAEPPLLLLDDVLSELDRHAAAALVERSRAAARADHGDDGGRAPGDRPADRGRSRSGEGRGVERIGGDVRDELSRFGPTGGMAEVVAAWPDGSWAIDHRERVAGADGPGRNAVRNVLVAVGLRARAARAEIAARCTELGEAPPTLDPLRPRTSPGGDRGQRRGGRDRGSGRLRKPSRRPPS